MTVVPIIKGAVYLTSAFGVNRVVTEIVRNNTTVVTVADKVLVGAGSLALSSIACAKTYDHVNDVFDSIAERFRKDKEVAASTEA